VTGSLGSKPQPSRHKTPKVNEEDESEDE
jgi:hypothetical protein